jgi:hypothetical protein
VEAGEHPDGGRLAGPVGAEEADDLAGTDLEGDPPHGLVVAVGLHEVGDADQGRRSVRRAAFIFEPLR